MVNRTHLFFKVTDRSYFAILKKEIHSLALSAGLNETKVGHIDIVVAEMVTNLVKHAKNGQLLVKLVEENERQGIELISIDTGPGMADINRMMADGVSTKNTLGHGLGAMKRLSDIFQAYSIKDWGTIILARLFATETTAVKKTEKTIVRSIVTPKTGETACGDGVYTVQNSKHVKIFLGDGLGHGVDAEKAVEAAGKAFLASNETDPVSIIREINTATRKTRGLVGTAAVFDRTEKKWSICGVGNVITKIMGPTLVKSYMSYNGIIGLNLPNTLNAQQVTYEKDQCLIMSSDGLKSRWETIKYYGINRYDPSVLAAALMKDFIRGTDDSSVVICKINA